MNKAGTEPTLTGNELQQAVAREMEVHENALKDVFVESKHPHVPELSEMATLSALR